MEWGVSVNKHLLLNTLRMAALQNNKQTTSPTTKDPRNLFLYAHLDH